MENLFREFLKEYESKVINLSKETALSYFNASISGKAEDYQRSSELQLRLSKVFTNKEDFAKLKSFKESNTINDSLLIRQLELIYNSYASNQFEEKLLEEIITLSSKIEETFATYRADVNGNKLSDNQIDEILDNSTDQTELEDAWKASKQIGSVVEKDVIELVKLRNKAACQMGYNNYHEMSLDLSEQSTAELDSLFDELDDLTRDAFTILKSEIDSFLSEKHKLSADQLMPWHYQDKFFQHGPKIYTVTLDSYFENKNIEHITKEYFNGMGLNIDDLIERSNLYEKEGKYQHAYCTDIDKRGDIRVVCNIKPNHRWMSTMLHEFGHAAYDKFINTELPWSLREPAHIFTTEAIAMLFGRFASNPVWLRDVIVIEENEAEKISSACFNSLRLEQLAFSRWVQVMYRFEKAMYENPNQDLNELWWTLVEKYQQLKKPAGRNSADWASKIHVALYPAYYHNYMLGELLASQLNNYILKNVLHEKDSMSFKANKKVGNYLKSLFFCPGSSMSWKDLIATSTEEPLSAKHYANQFVE
ncbi:MAG: M2 family metallopeptidase [Melioribacteraceae bacterium]